MDFRKSLQFPIPLSMHAKLTVISVTLGITLLGFVARYYKFFTIKLSEFYTITCMHFLYAVHVCISILM